MANYARIINDVAVDVSSNPAEQFHPIIAAEFQPVPDVVQRGWRLVGDDWQEPEPQPQPEPPAQPALKVSPVEFKLLFTSPERVAIKAARQTDPIVDDFFSIVEDPRLTHVDLGLSSTADGLAYLVSQNLLTAERRAQILSGTPV